MSRPDVKQIPIDIVGGLAFDRYTKMSTENTYNMLVSNNALVPYAGYEAVLTILAGENVEARGAFRSIAFNHLIIVINRNLYIVSTILGFSFIGQLDTSSGPVYITENEAHQVAIVDGLNIYIFNTQTSAFSKVPNLDFKPIYITFQDGYFIAASGETTQWRLSGPNNGFSWPADARNIGLLQTKPDTMQAVIGFNRQLFVFGKTVTEIWHDVGNTLFPYQRDNSISINYGVLSPATIAAEFDIVVWLASNQMSGPTLVYSTGGPPKPLATDGIEFLLDRLTNPEDSSGFLFQEDGHIFYQITFPTDNLSLVYDFSESKFYTLTDTNLNFHIARASVFFNNKNYFISFIDGKLYEFSTEITTYDRQTIPRIRITKNFRLPTGDRFVVSRVAVNMEQGASNQVQVVELSLSKDGGYTYGNAVSKTLNSLGNFKNRLNFWNLGSANDWVFQFRFYAGNDSVRPRPEGMHATERFVIIDAVMDIQR